MASSSPAMEGSGSRQDALTTSDGIVMFPKFNYPQPVPWARVPAAAGTLPSWEQKKLELGMAGLDTSADQAEQKEKENMVPSTSTQPASTGSTGSQTMPRSSSYSKLQKGPGGSSRPSGPNNKRPSFFSTLRSSSTLSLPGNTSNTNNKHKRDASYASSSGGIGFNAPQDGESVASSPRASSKKAKNPFMRFIQKNFSAKDAREQEHNQRSGASVSQVPKAYMGTKKGERGIGNTLNTPQKKTRSHAFAEKMKATSGKMTTKLQQTFMKFNSKTPKEQLPQTWEEWRKAYARGDIDIADMPAPPAREAGGADPSPFESESFPAPLPENQRERHLAFQRLDFEGKRGVKPSEIAVPEGEDPLPDTLEGHPAFRNIVTQARALFDTNISILTVFNENRQLFLAETGLGGMKEVPREVTFCSHAVLQRPPQPFILNDTHADWRFAKSPLVQGYGCRAYYGVPLLAPDFSGNSNEPIPIGTLCVIDNKPRDHFTSEQKSKMGDLALLAQKTIANWSRARLQARLDMMEKSFLNWREETAALTQMGAGQGGNMEAGARAIGMTPLQLQQKRVGEGKTINGDNVDSSARIEELPTTPREEQSAPALRKQASQRSTRAGPPPTSDIPPVPTAQGRSAEDANVLHISQPKRSAGPEGSHTPMSGMDVISADDSYVTAPTQSGSRQKIYDISTRLIGNSLELTLVYILRLDFAASKGNSSPSQGNNVKSLSLVSSFGLPSPEPAFDAVLHLKALQSEEGGLLYQNPNIDDLLAGERLPTSEEVEYASALLVPIAESEETGYVLAGFTDDPERVFERSDLEYMHTIASELAIYLSD